MNSKKCVFCNSVKVISYGSQNNKARWYCKECSKYFQSNTRKNPLEREGLFFSFMFGKQNISELALAYHIRKTKVQQIFDEYVLPVKIHNPRQVNLVVDGTYFSSSNEENEFCLIVFRDVKNKEDLWWTYCDVEREKYYLEGRVYLESIGYVIKSMISDGLSLIRKAFHKIPYQTCLVHVMHGVQRKTTKNPILEAGKDLLDLSKVIFTTDEKDFLKLLLGYKNKYFDFLNEKATSDITGKSWYVHKELREGFFHLYNAYPHMHTYLKDRKNIPRTSNSLEGHFNQIKIRVSVHHGLSKVRKQKLITAILLNSSVKLIDGKIRNS